MKKVVLLAINAKYVHSSLSVWLIAAGIKQFANKQYDVRVVEATINQNLIDIVNNVKEHEPDILGISTYIWNAGILRELLEQLRKCLPHLTVVLGGPEASHDAEHWLCNGADYVLIGEGEYLFPALLDKICDANLENCGKTPSAGLVNPYTDEYFSALQGRLSYIETSRGCPFRCAFCLSADSQLNFFPMDTVKSQIYKLSKSGTRTVKFVDRTFNCNIDRAYELFEYILGLDSSCCFHFEVAADLFDERCLSLLATAPPGLFQFEIGLQSFYKPALDASGRQANLEKAVENIARLLQFCNIHIHVDLIAGLPYETIDEFRNSFNSAFYLGAHTLQLGFLKLIHGSKLRKDAESLGIEYSGAPPYEITCSPWLSADDLHELRFVENALQNIHNKGRFLRAIDYALMASEFNPYTLMHTLGSSAPNYGTQLEDYVVQVYNCLKALPDVKESELLDCLVCDWLTMVKGKNAPQFLKNSDDRRMLVAKVAAEKLGREVKREEYAVLHSGRGVFVDSSDRDPVTGLYAIHFVELG